MIGILPRQAFYSHPCPFFEGLQLQKFAEYFIRRVNTSHYKKISYYLRKIMYEIFFVDNFILSTKTDRK